MKLNDRQIKNAKPAENRLSWMTARACICISIRAVGSYGGLTFHITANVKRFQSVNIQPYHWWKPAPLPRMPVVCLYLRPTFIYNHLYLNNFIQYYILFFPVFRLFPSTQIYPNQHKNVGAFVATWYNAWKSANKTAETLWRVEQSESTNA